MNGDDIIKKLFSCLLILVICLFAFNITYALEKGNPVAIYFMNQIKLQDSKTLEISDNYTALFLNGTFVSNYETILRNNRSLVPVRLISEELNCKVAWDEKTKTVTITKDKITIKLSINQSKSYVNNKEILLDYPAIIYNNWTYVPLRFISETLGATVNYYSPNKDFKDYKYYFDTNIPISPSNSIVRMYPNIIIDEPYTQKAISKEEALKNAKTSCLDGLKNFKSTMIKSLEKSGEPINRLDSNFEHIEKEIDRMTYIGEVSRYYKFTIGAYDILYDKYNNNMFFQIYSDGTIVKKFVPTDPELYTLIFIMG